MLLVSSLLSLVEMNPPSCEEIPEKDDMLQGENNGLDPELPQIPVDLVEEEEQENGIHARGCT
jgi:hypothetical protein